MKADELAAGRQLTYVHGYDDPAIIAGQGTIGLAILDQVPQPVAVIVSIGGGGLIAGNTPVPPPRELPDRAGVRRPRRIIRT
jgi:threonine dehydratase